MKVPIHIRKDIRFYHVKTGLEFRQDPYEKYDPMVIRQSMIHLSDKLHSSYPFQSVLDFVVSNIPVDKVNNILEIGCGVGRLIGEVAMIHPDASCWGIDFSYQMLKRAKEAWIDDKYLELDFSQYGFFDSIKIGNVCLSNLELGLSKCELLPFSDHSQDIVFSSFLIDRLPNPLLGLKEMKRILKSNGKIVIVTPFNFSDINLWETYYPTDKFKRLLDDVGLKTLEWKDDIVVREPLDRHGNFITWNCVGMVLGI